MTRVYWKRERKQDETARVDGSTIKRSSQTGESYGGLINHGGAKSRTPRVAGARYEITPFGVECLRIGTMCMPVLPAPKCRAELYLMPIEAIVPVGDKTIAGRTTRLDLGSEAQVDRNSWVMP